MALAERLFQYAAGDSFHAFSHDLRDYWDVLGPAGQQRYRELAEAAWKEARPRIGDFWRITRIMETLAELSGDIDALVAIKSRDLSSAFHYLDIARIYREANRPDEALEWAERGLAAFPNRPDDRLRDFLVAEYLERGRHGEALQLTWRQFEEQPNLDHYRKLHDVAGRLEVWPEQRERALAQLDAAPPRNTGRPPAAPNRTERVRIALWEKDLDAAWEAVQSGICQRHVLLALAEALEASRPADAAPLYRRVIPTLIEETNNRAYEQAIGLIRKLGGLMRADEFGGYLAEPRVNYKPKRNFIKLLDTVRAAG